MLSTSVILETGEERRKVVSQAIEGLGDAFHDKCREADQILIKVNLVHHENQLASTHVDAVRGLLDQIRFKSQTPVIVGDASYHGTKAAFNHFGYERLLDDYTGVTLVDLNDDGFVEGYSIKEDGARNTIRRSKIAFDSDFTISLSPMKMHRDIAMSGVVANWTIGTWIVPPRISAVGRVWARWPWLHEEGAWAHHASIAELYRQSPCDLGIIDAMVAMEGDGPTKGDPVVMNAVLAGFDSVAVDAVAATLMSVDPGSVGYLSLCAEKGLGEIDMTRIDVPPALVTDLTRRFERPLYFDERLDAWRGNS
jgi:uncharacterized protein (DUF362 family)